MNIFHWLSILFTGLAAVSLFHANQINSKMQSKQYIERINKSEQKLSEEHTAISDEVRKSSGQILEEIKNPEITPDEKQKLTPLVQVKVIPFPETIKKPDGTREFIPTKYRYPLKEYIVSIGNSNSSSAIITDCRLKFYFPYTIQEIIFSPQAIGNGLVMTTDFRFYQEGADGKTKTIADVPLKTKMGDNFSFEICKIQDNSDTINTNVAEFHCERWPKEMDVTARIVLDLSKQQKLIKLPSNMGTYEGSYWYSIKGKDFKQLVEGEIETHNQIGVSPALRGRINPLLLLSPEGTFTVDLKDLILAKGLLFELVGDHFFFIYGVSETGIFVDRNGILLQMPFTELKSPELGNAEFSIGWSSNNLNLTCHKGKQILKQEKADTPIIVIPNNLINWAQDKYKD
ncbi:MAG: hypothetical protein HQL30_06335 [Candidatus Omnitrophica bacterium]|nr:hypothetical protein [Candidatus Omnitrophota bacterium]